MNNHQGVRSNIPKLSLPLNNFSLIANGIDYQIEAGRIFQVILYVHSL